MFLNRKFLESSTTVSGYTTPLVMPPFMTTSHSRMSASGLKRVEANTTAPLLRTRAGDGRSNRVSPTLPVSLEDVRLAAARIGGAVVHTPCLRSETLSRIASADIWVKFENLQFTASFKERGALNTLLQLTDEERKRGVIAMSAGNHAQGVAYHAGRLGIPATIVMPSFTPNMKVNAHAQSRRARRLAGRHAGRGRRRGAPDRRGRQTGVRASLRRSAGDRGPGHDRARNARRTCPSSTRW